MSSYSGLVLQRYGRLHRCGDAATLEELTLDVGEENGAAARVMGVAAVETRCYKEARRLSGERDDMKRLILMLALLWPLPGLADFPVGIEALKRGDFATALREFQPLAEAGDAKAQYLLGFMYANGFGLPNDEREALKWYRLAAEQGEVKSQYSLGVMYYGGEGVPEDSVRAYAWIILASAQGDELALRGKDLIRERMTPAQITDAQKVSYVLCVKIPNCVQ